MSITISSHPPLRRCVMYYNPEMIKSHSIALFRATTHRPDHKAPCRSSRTGLTRTLVRLYLTRWSEWVKGWFGTEYRPLIHQLFLSQYQSLHRFLSEISQLKRPLQRPLLPQTPHGLKPVTWRRTRATSLSARRFSDSSTTIC